MTVGTGGLLTFGREGGIGTCAGEDIDGGGSRTGGSGGAEPLSEDIWLGDALLRRPGSDGIAAASGSSTAILGGRGGGGGAASAAGDAVRVLTGLTSLLANFPASAIGGGARNLGGDRFEAGEVCICGISGRTGEACL